MDDIEKIYDSKKDLWGQCQTYKSINFYPIKLKDVHLQNLYHKLFQFPKDFIKEKQIIKASYLKYLLFFIQHSMNPDGREIQDGLIEFLKAVTQSEKVEIKLQALNISDDQKQNATIDKILITIDINGTIFTETNFDIIREIVLRQNGLSTKFIEEYNPELEKHLSFVNSKYDNLSLEDEIVLFSVMMGKSLNEIENYTLYQFRKSMERLLILHNYDLYSPLEVSGQIKSKDGSEIVKHYFSAMNKSSGRYSSILISKDKFLESHPYIQDEKGIARNPALGN